MLKAKYPDKIFLGCTAHFLDLNLKDMAKPKMSNGTSGPCSGVANVLQKAIMASNVINGSSSVRAALAAKQEEAGVY